MQVFSEALFFGGRALLSVVHQSSSNFFVPISLTAIGQSMGKCFSRALNMRKEMSRDGFAQKNTLWEMEANETKAEIRLEG